MKIDWLLVYDIEWVHVLGVDFYKNISMPTFLCIHERSSYLIWKKYAYYVAKPTQFSDTQQAKPGSGSGASGFITKDTSVYGLICAAIWQPYSTIWLKEKSGHYSL